MSRILITGGTGMLGRALVERLARSGNTLRVMVQPGTPNPYHTIEWSEADLASGAGLDAAVAGSDIIVHLASSPLKDTEAVDVGGTRRLLELSRRAGISHFLYMSIVGIDHLPTPYYRYKLAAEALVRQAGVPWSIQRATQFHWYIDMRLQQLARRPISVIPSGFRFQPVDTADVAEHLAQRIGDGPGGRLADIGGPEVLTYATLAQTWLAHRGLHRLLIPVPIPGKLAAAFRDGYATVPTRAIGKTTWDEWLTRTYGSAPDLAQAQERA